MNEPHGVGVNHALPMIEARYDGSLTDYSAIRQPMEKLALPIGEEKTHRYYGTCLIDRLAIRQPMEKLAPLPIGEEDWKGGA
jgi:hypothetical protein